MIEQLLYESMATAAMNEDEYRRIEITSSIHNPLHDITGMLFFDGRGFMQIVEGGAEAIETLYQRLKDFRHRDVKLLHRAECGRRVFHDWAMRCVRITRDTEGHAAIEALLPSSLMPQMKTLISDFGDYRPS